jgi:hypothetical protein
MSQKPDRNRTRPVYIGPVALLQWVGTGLSRDRLLTSHNWSANSNTCLRNQKNRAEPHYQAPQKMYFWGGM